MMRADFKLTPVTIPCSGHTWSTSNRHSELPKYPSQYFWRD